MISSTWPGARLKLELSASPEDWEREAAGLLSWTRIMRRPQFRRTRSALDELRSGHAVEPAELQQRALTLVRQYSESDAALFYELAEIEGVARPSRWLGLLTTDVVERIHRQEIRWPTYADPARPLRDWNRRVVMLKQILSEREAELFQDTPMYRHAWLPHHLHDQLRMTVYHRGEFVAWIGGFRRAGEPRYTHADQRRLAQLSEALADALIHAASVERAGQPEGDCDLVLRPDGSIEYASPALRDWPPGALPREHLRRWVAEAEASDAPPILLVDGLRARWKRLLGEGAVRYLVHLEPTRPWRLRGTALLSAKQRRVVELITAGVTVREASQKLGLSENTTKSHLKRIYQELGVSNRAELVSLLNPQQEGTKEA